MQHKQNYKIMIWMGLATFALILAVPFFRHNSDAIPDSLPSDYKTTKLPRAESALKYIKETDPANTKTSTKDSGQQASPSIAVLDHDHLFNQAHIPVDKPFVSEDTAVDFISETQHDFVFDSVPVDVLKKKVRVNISSLSDLSEGRLIKLPVPHEQTEFIGRVKASSVILNTTSITGPIQNIYNDSVMPPSFSIVRGDQMTFVTVNTGKNIFYFEIDNATGNGVVYEESELDRYKQEDDSITPQINPT